MIHYVVLTTGSCGNCYVFHDGDVSIVVDLGVTMKKFRTELAAHEIPEESVKALFLTHLHPDHVKGVGAWQRKTGCATYVSSECLVSGRSEMVKQKIESSMVTPFSYGAEIKVGSFSVTPFHTFHDSPGASGYFISHRDGSFFIMTDTGAIPDASYGYSRAARVKFIESNYDSIMLKRGPYPMWLQERVRGRYGHLENTEAVAFAAATSVTGDQIYFIHVSENNNHTSLIRSLVRSSIPSGIFVKACERGEMFEGFIG